MSACARATIRPCPLQAREQPAVGVVALICWAIYELRVTNPLVDLRVSAKPTILMTNLAAVALGFALLSSQIAFPQLLQAPQNAGGLGIDLLTASILLMPSGLTMLAMSPVAGRLERRFGGKPLLIGARPSSRSRTPSASSSLSRVGPSRSSTPSSASASAWATQPCPH